MSVVTCGASVGDKLYRAYIRNSDVSYHEFVVTKLTGSGFWCEIPEHVHTTMHRKRRWYTHGTKKVWREKSVALKDLFIRTSSWVNNLTKLLEYANSKLNIVGHVYGAHCKNKRDGKNDEQRDHESPDQRSDL